MGFPIILPGARLSRMPSPLIHLTARAVEWLKSTRVKVVFVSKPGVRACGAPKIFSIGNLADPTEQRTEHVLVSKHWCRTEDVRAMVFRRKTVHAVVRMNPGYRPTFQRRSIIQPTCPRCLVLLDSLLQQCAQKAPTHGN